MSVSVTSHGPVLLKARLVRRQELWVWGTEHSRVRYERLVRLCGTIWRRLPLGPRRALCRRARRNGPGMTIVAVDWIVGRACYALAAFRVLDTRIEITGEVMDRLDDEAAMALIVHEVAHVYRLEVGLDDHRWGGYFEVIGEEEADFLVMEWGFDPNALERWEDENGAYLAELECRWSAGHASATGT
jgi:hypothetical protein